MHARLYLKGMSEQLIVLSDFDLFDNIALWKQVSPGILFMKTWCTNMGNK